jgi:hypothetical protein
MHESDESRWWRVIAQFVTALLIAVSAVAQGAEQAEPPPRLVVDGALEQPLSQGRVVIRYRTENLQLTPVFGPAAVRIAPRVGHLHVSVDDAAWVWMDASGDPVIIDGLPPGSHKILLRLQNANHQLLDESAVAVTVPEYPKPVDRSSRVAQLRESQPPAKIVVDPPLPEPLSRGVVFIRYRIENLQPVPVFGPAAVAVSPRVGHIQVTIDGAEWHWADASGGPVIINGLRPGRHEIFIQLVNPNGLPLDQATARVEVPPSRQKIAY